MTDDTTRAQRPPGWTIPIGIGFLFGIMLDQLAMGLIIGAAIGLVVAVGATGAAATPQASRDRVIAAAIGITLAGVAIVLAIASR